MCSNDSSNLIEVALEAIAAAFSDVHLGHGISLRQADAMDNYDGEQEQAAARALDEHEDWRRIPDELIEQFPHAMCFMDDAGILFHLPASMSFALRHYPRVTNLSADVAMQRVCDLKFIKHFKPLMTLQQHAAIVLFLRAFCEHEPCMREEFEEIYQAWG